MTSRQFYLMIWIITVSLKIQKAPNLIYNYLQKDSYLLIFAFLLINIVGICLTFFMLKKTKGDKITDYGNGIVLTIIKKLLLICSVIYFILQAELLFEAIQDLFSNILFDNLPWSVFGILLLFAIFYLAHSGITNIAVNFELYAPIILGSYLLISIMGGLHTDFTEIFPFQTVSIKSVLDQIVSFNIWFGDFFLIFFLGRHAKDIKLSKTLMVYISAMVFVILLYIEYVGMYYAHATMQPNLITVITDKSMIGLNVGRADWFLILFTEIGTILSCAVCLFVAKRCLSVVLPKIKKHYLILAIVLVMGALDYFYLIDINAKKKFFINQISGFSFAFKMISFALIFFISLIWKKLKQKDNQNSKINKLDIFGKYTKVKGKINKGVKISKNIDAKKSLSNIKETPILNKEASNE